ncbi:hypothetical protein T11_7049 [Trichinella zimbabwensis]|uniref:Uncharacterized protein n=1 Tax=Trichinella zimbabwensis TaxID=268475 RepID=A0A0V1G9R1_9BILA|nr:hypothetical protein T11_7049 [Trichinella zimbabwensis]
MLDTTDVSFTYVQIQPLPTQSLLLPITFLPEFMQIC